MVLALPLMVAIQMVSARIGYVTGRGLSENMRAKVAADLDKAIADLEKSGD